MSTHSSISYYRKFGIILACIVLVIGFIVILLNPLLTLLSLKQIDQNLYMMTYYGNGLFPESRKGLLTAYDQRVPGYLSLADRMTLNSTAISVISDENSQLVGHNHNDATIGPALLVVSKPRKGHAAIYLTNLAYLGYKDEDKPGLFKRFPLLLAPTMAIAGMNAEGLIVTTAAVRPEPLPEPEKKGSITGFSAVQLLLRKARTVEEALALLEEYPVKFEPWPETHYLIADANGHSAIVEYLAGKLAVTSVTQSYQVMSYFYVKDSSPEQWDEQVTFLAKQLHYRTGQMDANDLMDLLEGVAKTGRTQWSVVFNSETREINFALDEDFSEIHHIRVVRK